MGYYTDVGIRGRSIQISKSRGRGIGRAMCELTRSAVIHTNVLVRFVGDARCLLVHTKKEYGLDCIAGKPSRREPRRVSYSTCEAKK